MNKYPIWWDSTITIYNKTKDSDNKVTWYKTKVTGCFWKHLVEKVVIGTQLVETSNVLCRIPKNINFLPKHDWELLSDKSNNFTLSVEDIIVKGDISETINEYVSGSRSTDFIKKYKDIGCIVINDVTINTGIGRCNEHYLVKGV